MMFPRSFMARISGTVTAVLLSVWAGPLVHVERGHDADCDPALVLHDESKHRFTAPARGIDDEPVPGDHCVGCHFSRLMRGSVTLVPTGVVVVPQKAQTQEPVDSLAGDPRNRPLPARAPPVFA